MFFLLLDSCCHKQLGQSASNPLSALLLLSGRYQKAGSIAWCNFTGRKEFPALCPKCSYRRISVMRPHSSSSSFGSDAGAFHLSFPFVLVGDPPGCPEPATTTTKTCFRDQSYSYYTAMRQLKLVGNVTKGEIRGKAKGLCPRFTLLVAHWCFVR